MVLIYRNYWIFNMSTLSKEFIVVQKDIFQGDSLIARQREIGIIEKEKKDSALVFFFVSNQRYRLSKKDYLYIDITQTGDDFPKKICNICHRLLDTAEFAKNQNAKNNRTVRRPSCRECRKKIDGKQISLKEKRKWEANKPEYEPFQCPICQKVTIPGVTSKIVLDHNHNTGKIRGWICDSCNTGIGRFKDDISLLERAIAYLKKGQS